MQKEETRWSLGLMSGTSLDGIDAALIRTDGEQVHEFGAWLTLPYDEAMKAILAAAVRGRGDLLLAEHVMTMKHAEAVKMLLDKAGLSYKDVQVVGFHGQTVAHRPEEDLTWQMGNGALLAEKTKIDVVCDFRRRDVAAGGEGAPLVPLYHAALSRHMELPIAVLNIGGIANVTWIGKSERGGSELMALDILAFDTGPGNVMLNEWADAKTGVDYDADGKLALAGKVDQATLDMLLNNAYFSKHPPKSLDRNHFSADHMQHLSAEDGAATLTAFVVEAVRRGQHYFPAPARQWFVSGGGRLNPALMQGLKDALGNVYRVEALGWKGDALEAQAFAFLAVRSLKRLPLSLPTTTGALRAVTGGALYRA
ncbi:MAG: anhydro-N-acetylmuramic acid kinase [Alphaproteobacteria bacterium]|nr:anhydro-N-acetylmuramic acid kinase [Alphaproteobacteria bacterium]